MEGQHYLLFLPSKKYCVVYYFCSVYQQTLFWSKLGQGFILTIFLMKFYQRLICHLTVEGYQCLIWYHKTGPLFVYWLVWFQIPFFWKVILRNFALIDVWFFDLLWTHWIGINFCWLKLQISKTWNYSSLSFLKWHSTSIKSGDQWPIWSLFDDD